MIVDHKGKAVGFAEDGEAAPDEPVMDEVAAAGGDDIAGGWVGDLQPFQDAILAGQREGLKGYKRVKMDGQVKALMQQRRTAVLQNDWAVEPGGTSAKDEAAADFMREQLERIKWDDTTGKMHWGTFYGYAVAELLYGRDGRHIVWDEIRVRDRERFRFDTDFNLRLIERGKPQGRELPDRKFWWWSTGADHDDDPYGLGLAHYCYWPVYFKRQGMRFRLIYLEKFGHPTPVGKFPPGTPEGERSRLLQALSAMTTDQGVIIPEGMEIEKYEAGRGSSQSGYGSLHDDMNAAISKVILSQTMTTDDGSSRSQSDTHKEVADGVTASDSGQIDESFVEHPARWLTELNYPRAQTPKVFRQLEDAEDHQVLAERNEKISTTGYVPTQEKMDEDFGTGFVPKGTEGAPRAEDTGSRQPEAARPGGGEASFGEAEAEEARQDYADRVAEAGDDGVRRWGEQARELLEECASLAEFSERLVELYPEMDSGQLADVLGDAMGAARLAGRYEATPESEEDDT
jgi:phage gp29-like protein